MAASIKEKKNNTVKPINDKLQAVPFWHNAA